MSADSIAAAEVAAPVRLDSSVDRPWRRAWLTALTTGGAGLAICLLVNVLYWTATASPAPRPRDFLSVWYRWDTVHYLSIATHGYTGDLSDRAFFPFYPILVWLVNPVLPGGALSAGLFVSSVATIVTLAFLFRLTEDLFGLTTATRTAIFLVASPLGFYLFAAYNESLFIAFATISLYLMRRGQWTLAALAAGAASGTRYFGVLLALPFVIEYLRQRDWKLRRVSWDALAILLVPWGLVAFMIYSARAFGDPLIFGHLQQQLWGHTFSAPWVGPARSVSYLVDHWQAKPAGTDVMMDLLDLVALPLIVALLVLSVVGPWKLGRESWYLVAIGAVGFVGVLLSPMLDVITLPPMHGLPRYALEISVIFIVLARIGEHRAFRIAYLGGGVALQMIFLMATFRDILVS